MSEQIVQAIANVESGVALPDVQAKTKINLFSIANKHAEKLMNKSPDSSFAFVVSTSGKIVPCIDDVQAIAANMRFTFESANPTPKITSIKYASLSCAFVDSLVKEFSKHALFVVSYVSTSDDDNKRITKRVGIITLDLLKVYFDKCKVIAQASQPLIVKPDEYQQIVYNTTKQGTNKKARGPKMLTVPKNK